MVISLYVFGAMTAWLSLGTLSIRHPPKQPHLLLMALILAAFGKVRGAHQMRHMLTWALDLGMPADLKRRHGQGLVERVQLSPVSADATLCDK